MKNLIKSFLFISTILSATALFADTATTSTKDATSTSSETKLEKLKTEVKDDFDKAKEYVTKKVSKEDKKSSDEVAK
ncbi:MAG: hypothetical protein WBJ81_05980 [Rickettsiales bacterium]